MITSRTTPIALGLSLVGVAFACLAPADAGPSGEAKITEVRKGEDGASVLIDLGSKRKVKPGQSLEVRRQGKTIAYGSVDRVFSNIAVATVSTIVEGSGPLKKGDRVRFLSSGYKQGKTKPPTTRKVKPSDKQKLPRGKVLSVTDGIVLVNFGRNRGLEVGHLILLRDRETRNEVGRLAVELAGEKSGGGLLVSGQARVGLEAIVIGKVKSKAGKSGINFVELDFLGAVADLEHPTPHRAPCHIGVPVRRVLSRSPAQRSGIGKGDRIIAVDGIVVRTIAAVRQRIQARSNDRVRVLVIRGDRVVQVDVDFSRKK